jgi:signal transduction histidine kinase
MPKRKTRTTVRIAGFFALSFAVVSLVVGFATWRFTGNALQDALDDRLRDELIALQHADEQEGRPALIFDIVAFDAIPGPGRYLLNDAKGKRLAGRIMVNELPDPIGDTSVRTKDGETEPARSVRVRLEDGSTLAVVGETASMRATELTLLAIAAGGFGLVIVIGVAGGILSGRALHRRLSMVDGTARAIMEGDLTSRMPLGPDNDEFDQLSTTLNQMLDHIGRLMDSLRHVSADIAHDLRSPLSRLRAKLETGLDAKSPAEQRKSIAEALTRMDEILSLFTTILRISEVEAGGLKQWFEPVSLGPLVTDIVEGYVPAAQDSDHQLELVRPASDARIKGNENLLGQVASNLIENALHHTPSGSRIEVSVTKKAEGGVELVVRDNGPGVPASQHALVLRRFGRGEASRTTPGHGLGLTLVHSIARVHGAAFALEDAGPGLMVRIVFPTEE